MSGAYDGNVNSPYGFAGLDSAGLIVNSVLPTGQDALKIGAGLISNTVFGYLVGTRSPIQQQIDSIATGFVAFEAAAVATGNVEIANPTSAVFDTYTAPVGSVVLLPLQTQNANNGLYVFNGVGVAMTRLSTCSTWDQLVGSRVFVATYGSGSAVYSGSVWQCTVQQGGTIGTTAVTYIQIQQNYVAGANINIVGNVIAVIASPSFTNVTASTFKAGVTGASVTTSLATGGTAGDYSLNLPQANSTAIVGLSNAVASQFVTHITPAGAQVLGTANLSGLADVTLTSLATNQMLQYNGTAWVNVSTNSTVINQALALTSNLADVANNDTINVAISKLVSKSQRVARMNVNANYAMQPTDAGCIVNTAGVTITMFDPTNAPTGDSYTVFNNSNGNISVNLNLAGTVKTLTLQPTNSVSPSTFGGVFVI